MNFGFRLLLVFSIVVSSAGCAKDPEPIAREIPTGVIVQRDLVYASYEDRQLLLDLYRPSHTETPRLPVVLVIRGGGWRMGDKEGFGPMAAALAQRGFAAACIEYRASEEALFPAAVQDTKAAVRWIRANAEQFDLDPDAIGAIGGSAGAHLALYLGATSDVPELEGNGGNPTFSSSISAVVSMATPGDLTKMPDDRSPIAFLGSTYAEAPDLWEKASPSNYIGSSSPPLLLIHSKTDTVVPFALSTQLVDLYDQAGVPVELITIPVAPHAFWNFTEWFDETMDSAASFFSRELTVSQ